MKQALKTAAVAFILSLFLLGCSKGGEKVTAVSQSFSADIAATYRETDYAGTIQMETGETEGGEKTRKMTLCLQKPVSLQGLSIVWNGTDMGVEMGGMSLSLDEKSIPHNALIKGLFDALTGVTTDYREEDGQYTASGKTEAGDFTVQFSSADGLPVALSVPSLPLQVAFSNAKILEK